MYVATMSELNMERRRARVEKATTLSKKNVALNLKRFERFFYDDEGNYLRRWMVSLPTFP